MHQINPDLLRTERIRLGWTQAEVAEALGISIKTVRRWEQGQSVPYPYYRRQLSVLFGKTIQELGLLKGSDTVSIEAEERKEIPLKSLPLTSRQTSFLVDPILSEALSNASSLQGRRDLLTQLKECFFARDLAGHVVLHGLPGVGKTALAVALAADRQIQANFPDGILWAELGRHPKVLNQLARWGKLLGIMPSQVENIKSRWAWGQALRAAIGSRRFLLVVDDAWTVEDARVFLVGGSQCTYLLTTRLPEVASAFGQKRTITIPELEESDGLALLAQFVPQLVDQDPQGAQSLVQAVDCLPLALTLIGNSLAFPTLPESWPLRAALVQLQETQERLRLSMSVAFGQRWSRLTETVPLSLCAAIAICDQRLSPEAHAALCSLSVFPPKSHSFSREAALAVSHQTIEALDELWEAGLLESWGPGRYTLQQTVADYACAKAKSPWSEHKWADDN